MTEPAYTEQDLQRSQLYASECIDVFYKNPHMSRSEKEREIEAYLLLIVAKLRSEARAGMREACAGHGHTFLNGDCLEQCVCGHILGPKDMTWEQIQEAQREHIRKLPDLAADEAIERIKREARDELILRHRCGCEICTHTPSLCPATASSIAMEHTELERIAALSGKELSHD